MTISDVETLEKCQQIALRKLMTLPSKSPKQMLYFLTGSIPARFQIQRRRLVYFHHILNQDDESLLKTFFLQQLNTRKTKDWATTIMKDISEYEIELTFSEIKVMSVLRWKENIKIKTHNIATKYLNSNIGSKSRKYTKIEMAPYLCHNNEMPIETGKFVAKAQSHMIENIKTNFKQDNKQDQICNSCEKSECNQPHLLYCEALIGSNQLVTYIPNYKDIFDDNNIEEQCFIANILIENLKRKKELEKTKLL